MDTASLEAQIGFRVENGLLFHGENPRPATADEVQLWNYAVTALQFNESLLGQLKLLGADHDSVRASCEAYRAQQQRLYEFLRHEYGERIQPTDDAIEFAMAELQKSFEGLLTIKPIETVDAHSVKDGFGTPAENRL